MCNHRKRETSTKNLHPTSFHFYSIHHQPWMCVQHSSFEGCKNRSKLFTNTCCIWFLQKKVYVVYIALKEDVKNRKFHLFTFTIQTCRNDVLIRDYIVRTFSLYFTEKICAGGGGVWEEMVMGVNCCLPVNVFSPLATSHALNSSSEIRQWTLWWRWEVSTEHYCR